MKRNKKSWDVQKTGVKNMTRFFVKRKFLGQELCVYMLLTHFRLRMCCYLNDWRKGWEKRKEFFGRFFESEAQHSNLAAKSPILAPRKHCKSPKMVVFFGDFSGLHLATVRVRWNMRAVNSVLSSSGWRKMSLDGFFFEEKMCMASSFTFAVYNIWK